MNNTKEDITEKIVKVKLKNLHGIFVSVIVAVVLIVTAWFSLKDEIHAADTKAEDARSIALASEANSLKRLERIECLVDGFYGYIIHKKPPTYCPYQRN